MGITKPGYHLQSKWDLPSFRKRHSKPIGGRKISQELNLTAMIDMFSTIVLFLMTTFSATGDIMVTNSAIKLPAASHAFLLQRSPIVTVFESGVVVEGLAVDGNGASQEKLQDDNWELPLLKEQLRSYKDFFERAEAGVPFPGRVILQADKNLNFVYLKRAMYALVEEGYTNIDLVVQGEATYRPNSTASGVEPEAGAR
jgi:biopolymer transport protein ExbD